MLYVISEEQRLIQKSLEYVNGLISLQQLHDSALAYINDFLDSANPIIVELTEEIEASVVEIQEGILAENELNGTLVKILAKFPLREDTVTSSVGTTHFYEDSWKVLDETPTFNFSHAFA